MNKINFIYFNHIYRNVLDSIVNPIIKYLPDATKHVGYEEGKLNISFFIEDIRRNVAFMSHGMGDKGWRDGPAVKDYEYIFVSGPAWRQKYIDQGVAENKIYINGFPKLDPLFADNTISKVYDGKIHALYAPTHTAEPISSYPRLLESLVVPEDIDFMTCSHPYNNKGEITFEQLKLADVIISDCSSIIYEALSLDKPVVFPDWLVEKYIINKCPKSFTAKIYRENMGYHAENVDHMWDMVRNAHKYGIDDTSKRLIEGILPTYLRGTSGEVTAKILLSLAPKL